MALGKCMQRCPVVPTSLYCCKETPVGACCYQQEIFPSQILWSNSRPAYKCPFVKLVLLKGDFRVWNIFRETVPFTNRTSAKPKVLFFSVSHRKLTNIITEHNWSSFREVMHISEPFSPLMMILELAAR